MTLFRTSILVLLLTEYVYAMCSTGCSLSSCTGMKCSRCDNPYFLFDQACKSCPETCTSCVDENNCTTCKAENWGTGMHQCHMNCDSRCLNRKCNDSTGYCIECGHGKYGRKCQHNCTSCKNEKCDLYECSEGCKSGYFLTLTDSDYFCQSCPTNCKQCENGTFCRTCNDGFYLQQYIQNNNLHVNCRQCPNGKDCPKCFIDGCKQCQIINNELICIDCKEGEIFDGNSCVQTLCAQGCFTNCDSNGICLGNCTRGSTGENCSEKCNDKCSICSKSDKDFCLRCKGDFYSANCSLPCNPSCIKEQSSQRCKTDDGFCLNGCQKGSWGKTCDRSCSDGCFNSSCNRNNGMCSSGCKDGYIGDLCFQISTESTKSSIERSSSYAPKESTQEVKQKEQNESNDEITIAAAAGGGVLVLILIIVVGVCLLKRRTKSTDDVHVQNETVLSEDQMTDLYAKPMKKDTVPQETQDYIYAQPNKTHKQKKDSKKDISKPNNLYNNVIIDLDEREVSHSMYSNIAFNTSDERTVETETGVDEIELEELDEGSSQLIEKEAKPPSADLYYNTASLIRGRIQLSDFLKYSKKKTDYESEFEKLPKGLTRPCDVALLRNYRLKNRYNGVYAYDATRVVLQSKIYINANYIDGHKKSPEYIASLGPTKTAMNDFKDFWEMVWQERTDKIIMLTNLEEYGKMKCEKYWPDQGQTKSYHEYKVVCIAETLFSEFIIREFTVSVKCSEQRKVTQYHYTAWPDRSVPDNVASLIEFKNKVEQTKSQDDGPMVVHCSAGIGRTGTYIALDTLIKEGKDDNYIDIFGRVMALRGQRGHMVQNLEQYIFLHQCLLYTLTCDPDPLPLSEIQRIMTDDKISHQFQTFTDVVTPKSFDRKSSANKKVIKENRNGADIPGDQYRVRLCSTRHDYINAVYVNGYKNTKKFIVAQTPLPNTVEDFISMLYHEKCACIVDLDDENLKDKSIGHYLPQDGKVFKVGHFQVACKKFDAMEHATIRELTISRNNLSDKVPVKHYQYKGWTQSENVPSSIEPFLKLIEEAENEIKDQKSVKPIIVHCLTGAERSCLFCAVSIISEKCFFEKEISVLNTICQLRSRRKTAFSDSAQLRFCYHCVNSFSTTSDKKQYYNMAKLL